MSRTKESCHVEETARASRRGHGGVQGDRCGDCRALGGSRCSGRGQLRQQQGRCRANRRSYPASGRQSLAVQADVSKPEDVRRLFAETKKAFGKLDILVNNAGIYEFAPLEAISVEHFRKQFDLDVLGLLLTTQEAVKHFGQDGASIINISSVAATLAPPK